MHCTRADAHYRQGRTDGRINVKVISIALAINPFIATLKPQSNGPSYSNTVISRPTLAVDGWAVTFGTARRGLGGGAARPNPSSLYQMTVSQ